MVNEKPAKPAATTVEQSARKAKELLGERKSARISAKVARLPTTPQTKGRKPRGKGKGKAATASAAGDASGDVAEGGAAPADAKAAATNGNGSGAETAAEAAVSPRGRNAKKRSKPASAETETESTAAATTATVDGAAEAEPATAQAASKRQRTKPRGKAAAPKRRVSAETAALAAQAVAASAASAASTVSASDAKASDAKAGGAEAEAEKYDVVLCDIEGTTTPISFVKAILFPYIEQHLEAYLNAHWNEPETAADVKALQQLAADDIAAGTRGAVAIPSGASNGSGSAGGADGDAKRAVVNAVVANVRWQMSENRKSTALKQLQGHMWRAAYANGSVKGQLFADVKPNFDLWTKRGLRVAIYSSGSIEAQRLLFRYTDDATTPDLSGVLGGRHFDTTTGAKVDAASYVAIAKALGVPPQRVLFLTDLYGEAQAATAAGCGVCVMLRAENAPLPDAHGFATAKDFYEVDALTR